MNKTQKKFTQPWYTSQHFTEEVQVKCPKCRGKALASGKSEYMIPWRPTAAQVICTACSFSKTKEQYEWKGPIIGKGRRPCKRCGNQWISCSLYQKNNIAPLPKVHKKDCSQCGTQNEVDIKWYIDFFNGNPVDPFFGLELWYQTSFKSHTMWFYNIPHLLYIEDYISSKLRERGQGHSKYSIISNLPTWMKEAKNRDAILRVIEKTKGN